MKKKLRILSFIGTCGRVYVCVYAREKKSILQNKKKGPFLCFIRGMKINNTLDQGIRTMMKSKKNKSKKRKCIQTVWPFENLSLFVFFRFLMYSLFFQQLIESFSNSLFIQSIQAPFDLFSTLKPGRDTRWNPVTLSDQYR